MIKSTIFGKVIFLKLSIQLTALLNTRSDMSFLNKVTQNPSSFFEVMNGFILHNFHLYNDCFDITIKSSSL